MWHRQHLALGTRHLSPPPCFISWPQGRALLHRDPLFSSPVQVGDGVPGHSLWLWGVSRGGRQVVETRFFAHSGHRMPQVSVMSGPGWLPAHSTQHKCRSSLPTEDRSPKPCAARLQLPELCHSPCMRLSHGTSRCFCPVFRLWAQTDRKPTPNNPTCDKNTHLKTARDLNSQGLLGSATEWLG